MATGAAVRAVLLAAVTLAVVTPSAVGCGAGDAPQGQTPAPSTTTGPPPPAYDPPRQFGSQPVDVGRGAVAVADGVAYSYTETELVATDLAGGTRRWAVTLPDAAELLTNANVLDDPLVPGVVTDGDRTFVVAAYGVWAEGSGTQQDATETRVVAVGTDGAIVWDHTIRPGTFLPRVLGGAGDGALVIGTTGTVVLDLESGAERWTAAGVRATGVDGGLVLGLRPGENGFDPWTTVALHVADGAPAWTGPALETPVAGWPPGFATAGPGRALVSGSSADLPHRTVLIDTTTGTPVAGLPEALRCVYDERDTVVCHDPADVGTIPELVVALDARTGQRLWQLPDEAAGRTAFTVTAAFHGAVYGHVD